MPPVGSEDWRWHQTPFYLRGKEEREEIQIKLVFEGSGQIWVKDVELFQAPI